MNQSNENITSELDQPIWAAVIFGSILGIDISYAHAWEIAIDEHSSGAAVITADVARKSICIEQSI